MNAQPKSKSSGSLLLSKSLAWSMTIIAAAGIGFTWFLPDLGDSGRVVGILNWLAFCGRTFGYQIGIVLSLFAFLMLLRRLWKPASAMLLVALWCLWPTIWSLTPRGTIPATTGPGLSVYSVNAQIDRVDPKRLQAEIERMDADIVIIQEHTPRVGTIMSAFRARYPHVAEAMRDDAFGMAILSKRPFVGTPQLFPHFGVPVSEPQIRVVIDVDGQKVVVQGVHTLPPISFSHLRQQRQLIRSLAAWATQEKRPMIIAGDFNCTPESMGMGWMYAAGLSDAYSQRNAGRGETWPMDAGIFSLMGVKIDHLLLGNGLVSTHAELGESTGSDHRAMFARVAKVK
jgi:endonuclease/exonuclease/phosphatase (EEP) superfamily protein YafD